MRLTDLICAFCHRHHPAVVASARICPECIRRRSEEPGFVAQFSEVPLRARVPVKLLPAWSFAGERETHVPKRGEASRGLAAVAGSRPHAYRNEVI